MTILLKHDIYVKGGCFANDELTIKILLFSQQRGTYEAGDFSNIERAVNEMERELGF